MCRELRSLGQSITAYAGTFDARTLTAGQAAEVVRLCARIEASAASIKALAAARSAEGNDWKDDGYRSPADHLAHEAGMSPAAAKRALEAGRRMADQPDVAAAATAGDLSFEQAAAVSDGVAANPAKAHELIDQAQRSSLPELNEQVALVKAARRDQNAHRRAIHAKRSFRRWTDREGAMHAHVYGHPEDGARLWRMIDPIRRRLNMLRRESGAPTETLDSLDYDALMTMAAIALGQDDELTWADLRELGLFPQSLDSRASGESSATPPGDDESSDPPASPPRTRPKKLAGSPIRLMIRVDLAALIRGFPIDGELCDIPGFGPVPLSFVEAMLATENPFIIGILSDGQELRGVYHHGRHPNAYQRSALDFLYPTCTVEGCSATTALQYDHREDYVKTEITAFDLLDRLCRHHHRLKSHRGWALVEGRGKRTFVPPDDPRHPHFRKGPARSGPSPPVSNG
jgi:hypothetical protein